MTEHFKPLWARNVPKFGIAHAMALGVSLLFIIFKIYYPNSTPFQLAPWLAVEIPDLIEKGIIEYKEKGETSS